MLIRVQGLVQGVGFRPFVYGLATELGLNGWVRNTSAEVEILLQGQSSMRDDFLDCLKKQAPPLACIDAISTESDDSSSLFFSLYTDQYTDFSILPSTEQPGRRQPIAPDAALCLDCEQELLDSTDRRYLYPFLSCTNCGPRFTIIQDLPVDRQRTVMKKFPLCPACQKEYDNPLDRRFHAQASACPACGPRLTLHDAGYRRGESLCSPSLIGQARGPAPTALDTLLAARRVLREGKILAIKGLGGFHLACDADNTAAIAELRRRKNRPDKPFALMAADLEQIKALCQVSSAEAELLQGSEKPIVLLNTKHRRGKPMCLPSHTGQTRRSAPTIENEELITAVAPHLDQLGCMLPYTPLHLLLLNQTDPTLSREPAPALLVMTSGNRSGEPIITENDEALDRLGSLADALLLHDRPIHNRCDDSVLRVRGNRAPIFLRRSRGYAPYPIQLPFISQPLLAVGGQLKNTFCLADETQAFLSQHIGDMDEAATCAAFEKTVVQASQLFRIQPKSIVHDLHPQYFTSRFAQQYSQQKTQQSGLPCLAVQHHHAHIAACMVDNGLEDRQVIGLAFDGTGYGTDGTIWGGEILIASYGHCERFAHLQYLPLPGGEAAIRQPWRIAVGAAHALGIEKEEFNELPFLDHIDQQALTIIRQQVDKQINCPHTSSMGRLFDAAASLIGIRNQVSYEGQAAIELEVLSRPYLASTNAYPLSSYLSSPLTGPLSPDRPDSGTSTPDTPDKIIPLQELFRAMIRDIRKQEPAGLIGARLHQTIAKMTIDLCLQARAATGLHEVALSGGVWQNQLLLDLVRNGLEENNLTVYCHQQVPTNDGGLALGQIAVAHHRMIN